MTRSSTAKVAEYDPGAFHVCEAVPVGMGMFLLGTGSRPCGWAGQEELLGVKGWKTNPDHQRAQA